MNLVLYFAIWSAYFLLHSLLASNGVKTKLGRPSWYRTFYSIFSVVSLLPVFVFRLGLEAQMLFPVSMASKIPSLGFGLAAYFVFREAVKVYSIKAFLFGQKEEASALITEGILQRMRHPLYTGAVLLALGFFLWSPTDLNLVMVLSWFAYLPIGIAFEERRLVQEFGDAYTEYRKKVPAIFPRLKR